MDKQNALTSAELKRRGIAAIEQALQHGPVHLLKRNRSAAVVLSEQHYSQLQLQPSRAPVAEASALQWLLALPPSTSPRSKAEIATNLRGRALETLLWPFSFREAQAACGAGCLS